MSQESLYLTILCIITSLLIGVVYLLKKIHDTYKAIDGRIYHAAAELAKVLSEIKDKNSESVGLLNKLNKTNEDFENSLSISKKELIIKLANLGSEVSISNQDIVRSVQNLNSDLKASCFQNKVATDNLSKAIDKLKQALDEATQIN